MDTKLKKFSYSRSAKVLSFVLALLIVALMGSKAVSSYRQFDSNGYFNYKTINDVITFSSGNFDIAESEEFYSEYENIVKDINSLATTYKDGGEEAQKAYVKIREGEINSAVSDKYESILQDATQNGAYFETSNYSKGVIVRATKDDFDFSVYSEDTESTYYYKINMDLLRQEVLNEYSNSDNLEEEFTSNYNTLLKDLKNYKNIKVAVVDKSNGTIYSNISNLKSESNIEKMFSAYSWYTKYSKTSGFEYSNLVKAKIDKNEDQYSGFYCCSNAYNNESSVDDVGLYPEFLNSFTLNNEYAYYVALDTTLSEDDNLANAKSNYENANEIIKSFIEIEAILVIILILLTIYIILKTGRKGKGEEVKLSFIDKHYSFLHIVLTIIAISLLVCLMIWATGSNAGNLVYGELTVPAIMIAIYGVFLEWLTSFARSIKARSFFKNTIFYSIYKKIKIKVYESKQKLPELSSFEKPIRIFTIVYGIVMGVLAFIIMLSIFRYPSVAAFFLCIVGVIDLALIIFAIISAKGIAKIMTASEQAGLGNFEYQIDLTKIPYWLRSFANSILTMQEGTKIAIENAVKDEKMKTELITNVSHDLKTPLTSIVNYVDLLSKLDLNNEDADKYIGVLVEKSDRLKKLIEDLTEAAKASSGAIAVNLVKVNLNEIAAQIIGEISDELSANGIDIILKSCDNPVYVNADSRLTFRILENLTSNIKKYALSGTRAYVTVKEDGSLSVSNISKYPLDVSAEELSHRFVRGDASRSSEGSGLGLSIANDLAKLQSGTLDIVADSDMFKVILKLPKV